VLHLEPYHHTF